MSKVTVKDQSGASAGEVDLDPTVFGLEPNVAVMHQVVTAQLAAKRAGSHSTKRRAEVRGGGAKPWRQKGTGRARQGSIRAPQWRGGGVAMGPKPRDYSQRTPKKMVRLALRSALSDRASEGNVVVVERWEFPAPRTREAVKALEAIGAAGRVLVVLDASDRNAWLSFRNLPDVHVLTPGELNAYDVLVSDVVVFTRDNLPDGTGVRAVAAASTETSEEVAPKAVAPKPVVPKPVVPKPVATKPVAAKLDEAGADTPAPRSADPVDVSEREGGQ